MLISSIFVIEPNDFGPTILRDVLRQKTRSVGDAVIRFAVPTFVLQGCFGEIENRSVLPCRRLSPPLGSLRYFDLNGAPALSRQVLFDNNLRNSQDAIPPATSGLWFPQVNDARHLRESSNNSVFAALQNRSDITN
jgi:hypothetical protein